MASTKISALPVASTLDGTESIPVVQGGVTKKVTTDQFLIKDAIGNVGVGVTPSALFRLDINGNARISSAGAEGFEVQPGALTYVTAYNRGTAAYTPMAVIGEYISFGTGLGAERARIDASGNLGLGVTPSAWGSAFDVVQMGAGTALTNPSSITQTWLSSNAFYDTGWKYMHSAESSYYQQSLGSHSWFTAPSGTAGNPISFTQAMTLDASGKLGLGVTPSAWVSGARAVDIGQYCGIWQDASGYPGMGFNAYQDGVTGWTYKTTGNPATRTSQTSGAFQWYTAPSGTAGNAISFTQVMALNASGVLTLTPTTSQAALFNYSGGAYTTWQHSGTSLGDIGAANQVIGGGSSADFAISSRSGSLVLGTANGVERATLAADGRLTLGAATNGAIGGGSGLSMSFETGGTYQGGNIQSFAGNTLNINPLGNAIKFGNGWGQFDASGNLLVGTTSTGINDANCFTHNVPAGWFGISHVLGTASGTEYINFGLGGVVKGSITQNGTTGVNYNTSSDARLKENIAAADNGSALIDGLQVRKFDWKADGSHQRFGFVAQELDAVYPEAVSKPADPDEMMGVDYSKLVPLLVQEIQSLRARLAAAGI